MGATSVIILAFLALASASVVPDSHRKLADKDTLVKQKNILQLLVRLQQPTYFQEILTIGNNYRFEDNLSKYKNQTLVKQFLFLYQNDYFNIDETFNVLEREHIEQVKWVFDLLYSTQDYETFYKTASWLRVHIDGPLFGYSLTVAVAQHPDTQDITLPPPYEILPNLFIRSDIIQRAYQVKMRGLQSYNDLCDIVNDKYCVLLANYTRYGSGNFWYPDQSIRYLTEDVGLNALYQIWNLEHPIWLNNKEYNLNFERRGELFLYFHRQILARYILERIGNGLGEVEPVQLWQEIRESYYPHLRLPNGQEVASRSEYTPFLDTWEYSVNDIYQYERRIIDAIDSGIVFSVDGQKCDLISPKGINILGEIIMGVSDSINRPYYGALYNYLRILAGGLNDQTTRNYLNSGVLHYYASSLRDPLFYRLIQRINNLWQRYVERLGPYSQEELIVPGLTVENVDIDKLITYFDYFDVALNNAVEVANEEDANNVNIVTRLFRLNHQPFSYRIAVKSDKATKVVVRIFLGPKYDQVGQNIPLSKRSQYYVELDRFPYQVQAGENVIQRSSRQSTVSIQDLPSFTYLYKQVEEALEGKTQFYIDQSRRSCGYPDRLVLPRGKKQGQVYSLYVLVSEYQGSEISDIPFQSLPYCGPARNAVYVDDKPAGYPFNRPVGNEFLFSVPNSYFKDVIVFHKKQEEVNSVQDV